MKKTYYYAIAALMAVSSLTSCGDKGKNDEPVGPVKPDGVEVSIATTAIETKAATLEFGSSAKMNIFAKTFARIDAPNIVDGVAATYDGSKWTMEPKVYINDTQKNAFIYAVSPYDPAYTDPQNIPVDLAKQVDLMYSGSYQPASLTSPSVRLTMKHALSLLSFNIVGVNYTGAGNVTSFTIEGDNVYVKGTMNASTGDITLTEKGKLEAKANKAVQAGGWTSDLPGMWVLPFNTRAGAVKFTAVIDGKTYVTELPEVEVKTGWQYIFRLALTNNGLEFDPSKTETKSLNVVTDDKQQFDGYGLLKIITSGSWINSPVIEGDGVFGTVKTPSGGSTYNGSERVDGLKSGDNVYIESWNSNGFKLETLDGIETIDISGYE